MADVGIELGFFKDRLTFKASYYDKKTIDQITDVTIPSSSGFTSYKDNLGEVSNRGFELDLRYNFYRSKNLELTAFGKMAHNKNKIVKINDALKAYNELVQKQYDDYDDNSSQSKYAQTYTQYVEGGSIYAIYGMKSLGINPANGREVYQRPDGTITYDWNAADQVEIGNREPWAQGFLRSERPLEEYLAFRLVPLRIRRTALQLDAGQPGRECESRTLQRR